MSEQWLLQLRSPDPEQRRQAIIALGRAKDPRALRALAEVYRNDPVPALRQMALQAGRYIRQQTQAAPAPSRPGDQPAPSAPPARSTPIGAEVDRQYRRTGGTGLLTPPEEKPPPPVAPGVSPRDVKRAKGHYDRALDLHMAGDDEKALEELRKALAINPGLQSDPVVSNLAQTITGVGGDQVWRLLTDAGQDVAVVAAVTGITALPSKKKKRDGPEITWNDVAIDATLLFAVTAVGQVIVSILTLQMLPLGEFSIATLAEAIGAGTVSVLNALVSFAAIHVVAGFMGGRGSLTAIYHALIPIYAVLLVVLYVVNGASLFMLGPIFDSPTGEGFASLGTIYLVMLLALIGWAYWVSKRVSEVHDFGIMSGCGAVFFGLILFIVVQIVAGLVGVGIASLPTAFGG